MEAGSRNMQRTICSPTENMAMMKLNHCCARSAEGSMSTSGETKIARMNKIKQATRTIVMILSIASKYNISR
jgi:hypothetical protein